MSEPKQPKIADRFRGFLPVVVDVETAGFNSKTDALLEIAAVLLHMDDDGCLQPGETINAHVEPFAGANLDQRSLDFLGIDPFHPFRFAVPEKEALDKVFAPIRKEVKRQECSRAILVGHNPFFDLGFLKEAVRRVKCKKNPFHAFSTFDTVTLGGLAFGQTVLARAVKAAGHEWDNEAAHSAAYDAEQTAKLFCAVVNRWRELEGTLMLSPAPDVEISS
ncbi:ribonuclease T [Thiohalomonas denitrificans]|uniref:ribonuclease T n=1 Tax=Thiohalomonas denitrificans TaxID=415747 RepID=UPI0026F00604|nr:ribonuclease T [Thiohalomonas denitrificans]